MKRQSLFWGIILILVGGLFLLSNLDIIAIAAWNLIWPILVIAFGLWLLLGVFVGRGGSGGEQIAIPLEGAESARVRLNHGAGRLLLSEGSAETELAQGTFGGGLNFRTQRSGNRLDVKMSVPEGSFPFFAWPGSTLDWDVAFNQTIPLSMEVNTGASESRLNLENLRVVDLKLATGASSTVLHLPARAGFTRARVEAGAASVEIYVPEGVGARIHVESGLAEVKIDRQRFPRNGDLYLSSDYELSQNKVDLDIQTGVGSVTVR